MYEPIGPIELINGWTKKKLIDKIKSDFKGRAVYITPDGFHQYCQYLTKDGRKCGVGLFIPDGHPAQMAAGSVVDLLEEHPDLRQHMPMVDKDLSKLQNFHDIDLKRVNTEEHHIEQLIKWVDDNVIE